ncbi:MAG: hypothetical protein GY796_27895 [Chloroflexi bacterium]|nr:hypothetical protein [Chloroflexota bacterium]
MLKITGTVQRTFIFPADFHSALIYYSELTRVAQFMPHISLVHIYAPHQIRTMYETDELGAYTIRIFTDLEGKIDPKAGTVSVYPVKIPTATPIQVEANMRETIGQGLFSIEATLFDLGDQTRMEAVLRLQASLKQPRGMKMMPKRVVNRIANGITKNRMREMADGFIKTSIEAFPEWQSIHQPA